MTNIGFIFSNLHDKNIPELTTKRAMGSIPFAGRYRLIDFSLSNMVNSGITDVSVITHNNYQSLMDHLGSGKDWDLARRSGGLKLLPPYINANGSTFDPLYNSRLEALKSVAHIIGHLTCDNVVFSDCDAICNIDIADMLREHSQTGADITIAVKGIEQTKNTPSRYVTIESDADRRITAVHDRGRHIVEEDVSDVMINVWAIRREYLQAVVENAAAKGQNSFLRDVIAAEANAKNFRVYRYDGYYANLHSLVDYYACNMELLGDHNLRSELFGVKNRPILTKIRNSPPTKYAENSGVKNSLVADGCIIEGEVENSILFRGTHVGKGSRVKNSILFQDTRIERGVSLNCVITDKNVVIREDRTLSGHPTLPFYIGKGRVI